MNKYKINRYKTQTRKIIVDLDLMAQYGLCFGHYKLYYVIEQFSKDTNVHDKNWCTLKNHQLARESWQDADVVKKYLGVLEERGLIEKHPVNNWYRAI